MISSTSGFMKKFTATNDNSVPMTILLTMEAMTFSVSVLPFENTMSMTIRDEKLSTSAATVITSISRLSFIPSLLTIEKLMNFSFFMAYPASARSLPPCIQVRGR